MKKLGLIFGFVFMIGCSSSDKTKEAPAAAAIDKEGIRKVFFENSRAIRQCYEATLKKEPALAGVVKLDFDIVTGGLVEKAKIKDTSSLKNEEVHTCLLATLKTLKFPEPPAGTKSVNVIYPLAFVSKKQQKQ